MTALPKSGRACSGFLLSIALCAGQPLAAQTAEDPVAREIVEEVQDEVRSLNTSELEPLEGEGELGMAAPLTDFADFGVAWPDMSEVPDSEIGEAAAAAAFSTEQRYSIAITGLEEVEDADEIREQFAVLSTLEEHDDDPAVVAQIDRRAEADTELLREILRSQGYYDARVTKRLSGQADGDGIDVELAVASGPLYHFEEVSLPGLAEAGARADELRAQFEVEEGDPVDARQVVTARARLTTELGNRGYPFANVGEEEVIVDHASRIAVLTQPVEPGGERDFGGITVTEGAEEIFGVEHVETIARFERGELYSTAMVDDLRRALIQTGLVSRVEITPVDPGDSETVDISVAMQPAPPRTIAGRLGYGTGEGASAEVNWEHRNLLGPEGAVGVRAIAGTEEQYLGFSYRRSNFLARDHILAAQLFAGNLYRDAYAARTLGITASLERVTNQLWQKTWVWSVGAELLASDERDFIPATGLRERRTFFIGALPMSIGYDSTNDLLNPQEGFRFGLLVSPELSFEGGTFPYARIRLDGSTYVEIMDSTTLAARIRLGAIPGAAREDIAPSRRFYAGGGASVRGYGYQSIGPRDANNDPIGGRSLIELSLEARYRFGNFGIVPFIDAGAIYGDVFPDFSDLRFGAGIGARYYSNFGPIRIDIGTPLNPQPGDPWLAVYVSLGQAF